jgi:Raf kinase inhibitor-like YbhB/YbcL family protein
MRYTLLAWWAAAVIFQPSGMTLTSPAFKHNAPLPLAFTGYGDFKSPPLAWRGAPTGTREFVLTLEDADVPLERFSVHWLLWDIPATATALPEAPPDKANRDHPSPIKGAVRGSNAMKRIGYLPPRPFAASGVHHYNFTLYAIDFDLTLPEGASKEQLLAAIKGHVLAEAKLTAVFERNE